MKFTWLKMAGMNAHRLLHSLPHRLFFCLACLAGGLFLLPARAADFPPPMKEYVPTNGDFASVEKAFAQLLQTRDTAQFATNMTMSVADYQSLISSNSPTGAQERAAGFAATVAYAQKKMEASAKALLAKADELHVDLSKGDWQPRVIIPQHLGRTSFMGLQAAGETVPFAAKLEIVLDPKGVSEHSTNDTFKISCRGLAKFSGGWHSYNTVQWESFPADVMDEKTRREITILNKVAEYKGFNQQDDPALLKLGETLVRFVREQDTNIYRQDVLPNADLIWDQFQKSGQKGPTRKELDDEVNRQMSDQLGRAQALLQQMNDAGVDFKKADIQIESAAVERGQAQGKAGSLDGLMGQQFKLTLAVKTDAKSKNGTSLSGNYILTAKLITRFGDDWRIEDGIHWFQLPAGIIDAAAAKKMNFENYVAEHGSLPPGMVAPEIEFTTLNGGKKMKLSDLRGKVVVLDFWATWCGPCQEPMADLQKIRDAHASWGDKVAIVPISIDDTSEVVIKHVDKRGWTNTFNVWAGDGGWQSAPAKTFRVTGVPTTYIIGADGEIIIAGHPMALRIPETVESALKK